MGYPCHQGYGLPAEESPAGRASTGKSVAQGLTSKKRDRCPWSWEGPTTGRGPWDLDEARRVGHSVFHKASWHLLSLIGLLFYSSHSFPCFSAPLQPAACSFVQQKLSESYYVPIAKRRPENISLNEIDKSLCSSGNSQ